MFKFRDDPRVTRVGRLAAPAQRRRAAAARERAAGRHEHRRARGPSSSSSSSATTPEQRFRLEVKPGVTGPMQVYGRGELTFAERLAVELDYVENLSLGQRPADPGPDPRRRHPRHRRLLSGSPASSCAQPTVIVPSLAPPARRRRLLDSLASQTVEHETIVIDNASPGAEVSELGRGYELRERGLAWSATGLLARR